jgi:hypothetical protein
MKMMRSIRARLFLTVASLAALAGWCRSSNADVSNATLTEQVSADATTQGGDITAPPPDSDSTTNNILPPTTLSAFASSGLFGGQSSINIATYTGPMIAGDTTPGLDLSGSTSASAHDAEDLTSIGEADASASFTYNFSLDETQPYTFSADEDDSPAPTLSGPNGSIDPGSGSLSPGDYTLSASSSDSDGSIADFFNTDFSLQIQAVPEPASSLFFGIGFLSLAIRRRR